ncbi:MAG: glycosyltransferase family 9 protein [Holophagaceae bacterium]|nr:glycosyltransferase family 9 protein [Holophagaceae bacterium]
MSLDRSSIVGDIPQKAVWVRVPRFIGDSMMIHQALEPLRATGVPLVAWGSAHLMELFEGSTAFNAVYADPIGKPGAMESVKVLRKYKAAAVINLPRSTRALLAAYLARVPVRLGWREAGGRVMATGSLQFKGLKGHQVERYHALIHKGFPNLGDVIHRPFRPRPEAEAQAVEALREYNLEGRFILLSLGAMSWNKRLGTAVWVDLIHRLLGQGIRFAMIGGSGEDERQAQAITEFVPGIVDLTGLYPLSTTAALVARAAVVVANDSGIGHMAAACQVPVISIFGPTTPAVSAPYSQATTVLQKAGLDCLGCHRFDCPVEGHPCMNAIEAQRIFEAVKAYL